ncbi:MAG: ABC transporter ATP-binding protein [Clostridiales bacterium]|nr:ABC transporter ATP-binding protein [Clostridiales bacterium]
MKKTTNFAPPEKKLKLRAYIFKYPKEFWLQAGGGILYNTLIVSGPIFLGKAIDAAANVKNLGASYSPFYLYLILFVISTALFQVARYFKRWYMRDIANRMKCDMRAGLLETAFNRKMSELDTEKVGDMMSRMIGDVDQVCRVVQITITEIWDACLLMISYFVACMIYTPSITLLAIIPIPLTILAAQLIRHPLYRLSLHSRESASNVNVHLQHTISSITLLRLFGREESEHKKLTQLMKKQLKWGILTTLLQNAMIPIYILSASLGLILIVGMGGKLVINGQWTIGTFTAYLTMFSAMAVRTNMVARVFNMWHGAKASWDRILIKLSTKNNASNQPNELKEENITEIKNLKVENLSFSFTNSTKVLDDISFNVLAGQIIGITGPVGSGKSALAQALSGLYPYEGKAQIDGLDIFNNSEVSGKIAYMDSDHFVFSRDVRFNIGLERKSEEEILVSSNDAALTKDIEEFDEGLLTKLGERGQRISGGQRQRICLARALASNAKILILDDPFSAIDINLEEQIMSSLKKDIGNRIILLFSHRLMTFSYCNQVMVLEKGRLIQKGPHETLVNTKGLYKDIFEAQCFMGGEEND